MTCTCHQLTQLIFDFSTIKFSSTTITIGTLKWNVMSRNVSQRRRIVHTDLYSLTGLARPRAFALLFCLTSFCRSCTSVWNQVCRAAVLCSQGPCMAHRLCQETQVEICAAILMCSGVNTVVLHGILPWLALCRSKFIYEVIHLRTHLCNYVADMTKDWGNFRCNNAYITGLSTPG